MNAIPIRWRRRVEEVLTTLSKHDARRISFIPGEDLHCPREISCQVGRKSSLVGFNEFPLIRDRLAGTEQFIDFDGLALASDCDDIQEAEIKILPRTLKNRFTRNDRGSILFIQCLEPGREIDGVTDRGVVHPIAGAEMADQRGGAMETETRLKWGKMPPVWVRPSAAVASQQRNAARQAILGCSGTGSGAFQMVMIASPILCRWSRWSLFG